MKCPFTFSWEKITPELAAEWLKSNTHNRPLRSTTVDAYARDMKTNRWSPNHQGIAFSLSGALLDGQHRLSAIVASGVAVWCMVFRGIPERVDGVEAKVAETVDRGNTRSLADLLKLDYGITDQPATVAAGLLHLARLCVDNPSEQAARASMPQIALVLQNFAPAMKWLSAERPRTLHLRSMLYWSTFAFAYMAKPREVGALAEGFKTGAGLAADSALLTVRNLAMSGELEDMGGGAAARWKGGVRILAGILAAVEGRPMRKLPPHEEAVLALKQWRLYQSDRVATIAAAFPLLRAIDEKRVLKKNRQIRATLAAPVPPAKAEPVKITRAADLKPTAAAARLLARR